MDEIAAAMPQPRTAQLVIVTTSPGCTSYRLYERAGDSLTAQRLVWSNRVVSTPEGDRGARGRMTAWARAHGYRIVDRTSERRRRA